LKINVANRREKERNEGEIRERKREKEGNLKMDKVTWYKE